MAEPDPAFQEERLSELSRRARSHELFPYFSLACLATSVMSIYYRTSDLVGGAAFLGFIACGVGSVEYWRFQREISLIVERWEKLGFVWTGHKLVKSDDAPRSG
jgi:hypothetical protein